MKRIVLLFIVLICQLAVLGQPPKYFFCTFGGPGDEIGKGVKQTPDGNYIIVGSTTSFGAGQTDAYLLLVDNVGQKIWQHTFGGTKADVGNSIVINPLDSGFIFTGYTNSTDSTGYDIYVVRTDKKGNAIWESKIGGPNWEFSKDVEIASDGNLMICGNINSGGQGKQEALVLKVDISNGNKIWQKQFGGTEDDAFNSIYTRNGNEFFVVGTTKSYGDINGDLLCFKLNANGDSLLRIVYGGNQLDEGNDVVVIDNGDIILVGGSESFTNGKKDAFFVKFSPAGVFKWKKNRGLAGYDEQCYKIIQSQTPNLEETILLFSTEEAVAYKKDVKTIFMNYDGDYYGGFDSGKFGFPEDDEAFDIAPCKDKGYIQVGYITDTVTFDKNLLLIKQDSNLMEKSLVTGLFERHNLTAFVSEVCPNPVLKGSSSVMKLPGINIMTELEVYDALGHTIHTSKTLVTEKLTIPSKDWMPGMYMIRVRQEDRNYISKLLVW